jgi:hypothetical protein
MQAGILARAPTMKDKTQQPNPAQLAYVRELLKRYVATPGVHGRVRRADRELAARLYDERVPLFVVQNAFILAAARRLRHNAYDTPLPPVRSVHYFIPVIREVLERPPGPRDIATLLRILGVAEPPL